MAENHCPNCDACMKLIENDTTGEELLRCPHCGHEEDAFEGRRIDLVKDLGLVEDEEGNRVYPEDLESLIK